MHCCGPLTEAVDLVRPLAAGRDIAIEQDLHAGLYEFVLADYQRLKQVLLNVLTNAVKYNRPGGTVRIVLQMLPDRRLRYRFADTGRGIAPEDLERAFLPFERLDADSTDAEGTGLGLALSKGLIDAMGGAIGVERSVKGEGSTFYVDLPLTDNPHDDAGYLFQPERTPFPRRIERGGRVLYIEDNLANYDLVQKVFDRLGGLELMSAMQGQMGIELAAQHQPDLILLDLHLPDIDGEEVLRRLRADERMRDIPVIILSADATPAQAERLKARGAEDYLTKPLELVGFVEAVERALGPGHGLMDAVGRVAPPRLVRVVIADDHPVYRKGAAGLINGCPELEVVGEAGTGAEALEGIRSLAPDVAVVDLGLPDFDGIAVDRHARARGLGHAGRDRLGLRGRPHDLPGVRPRRPRLHPQGQLGRPALQHAAARRDRRERDPALDPVGPDAGAARAARPHRRAAADRARARDPADVRRRAHLGGDRGGAVRERPDRQDAPAAHLCQARGLRPRGSGRAGPAPRPPHLIRGSG